MEDWHALLANMKGATTKVEKGRSSIFYQNLYIAAILVLFILILLWQDHNMTAIGNATTFLLLVRSTLLPLLLIYYQQQEQEQEAAAQKEKEINVKSTVAMAGCRGCFESSSTAGERRRGRQWCPNKTAPPFPLSTRPGKKACNSRGQFLANTNF